MLSDILRDLRGDTLADIQGEARSAKQVAKVSLAKHVKGSESCTASLAK